VDYLPAAAVLQAALLQYGSMTAAAAAVLQAMLEQDVICMHVCKILQGVQPLLRKQQGLQPCSCKLLLQHLNKDMHVKP
jgi:hypothetical protein